jgi:hypothetical protein
MYFRDRGLQSRFRTIVELTGEVKRPVRGVAAGEEKGAQKSVKNYVKSKAEVKVKAKAKANKGKQRHESNVIHSC